jgi:hypothetical protein
VRHVVDRLPLASVPVLVTVIVLPSAAMATFVVITSLPAFHVDLAAAARRTGPTQRHITVITGSASLETSAMDTSVRSQAFLQSLHFARPAIRDGLTHLLSMPGRSRRSTWTARG